MSKWLERLAKIKNTPSSHSQNPQKPPFEPFVSVDSGIIQKKGAYPSIWDVTIQTNGKVPRSWQGWRKYQQKLT